MKSKLEELIKKTREYWNSLSPAQQEAMIKKQIEGVAKAEASWPPPKYHYENGVKVYHSYEDYLNG